MKTYIGKGLHKSGLASCRSIKSAILLGGMTLAAPAMAQSDGVRDDTTADKTVADDSIIVTAQRREERLQDVPISVSVLSGAAFQAFGQNSTLELAYRIPNVSLNNGAAARQFGFFIRGYGSTSFAPETIESSTAFVLDGVVFGQGGGALMDLPDIDRIEVLRGPQGTLFGKNSGAGVVNVTTRRPSATPLTEIRATVSSPQFEKQLSAYVSGPLNENARYSLSVRGTQRNGFIKNVFDGRDLNDETNGGIRARLDLDPTGDLSVSLIGDYWKRDSDCCVPTLIRTATPPNALEAEQIAAGIDIRPGNMSQNIDGYVFSRVYAYGVSAQADYNFDGYTLTSLSAYRGWGSNDGFDLDSRPIDIFNINEYYLRQKQFSQELRIASPTGKMFDFVAGLFYFNQSANGEDGKQVNKLSTAFLANRLFATLGQTENVAAFGQANINLSADFRLIAGFRVLKENIRIQRVNTDILSNITQSVTNRRTDDALVWRFGAQYDISDDINVFATATRGFKGGGFDSGPVATTAKDVLPERPTNYEVGLRSQFRDAGLTFNVTGFWQDIKNLQVTARDPSNTLAFFLLNAATARTRGIEWDVSWRPSRDLDLSFVLAGSYTDAEFTSFPFAPCYRGQTPALGCVGGSQNLTGTKLPYAEKWNVSLTTNLELPLAGGNLKALANAFLGYKSSSFLNAGNDPGFRQPGYPLVNLAVGLASQDDRWNLRAFVRNLTDEAFAQRIFSTTFGGAGSHAAYYPYQARRIIGLNGMVRF